MRAPLACIWGPCLLSLCRTRDRYLVTKTGTKLSPLNGGGVKRAAFGLRQISLSSFLISEAQYPHLGNRDYSCTSWVHIEDESSTWGTVVLETSGCYCCSKPLQRQYELGAVQGSQKGSQARGRGPCFCYQKVSKTVDVAMGWQDLGSELLGRTTTCF